MSKATKKLFFSDPFLTQSYSRVLEVSESGIVCEESVAFPEGGGQQGDRGNLFIRVDDQDVSVPFYDTQKGVGRTIFLADFPTIQVDTPVYHKVNLSDLSKFTLGMDILQVINVERRARLMVSHSALHLVLMGLDQVRKGVASAIRGCSISETSARLDFAVQDRFSCDEIARVTAFVKEVISNDEKMVVFRHAKEPEAWYWKCRDFVVPCGGTHLPSASFIGPLIVRRSSRGKGIERINAEFPEPTLPLQLFHS